MARNESKLWTRVGPARTLGGFSDTGRTLVVGRGHHKEVKKLENGPVSKSFGLTTGWGSPSKPGQKQIFGLL